MTDVECTELVGTLVEETCATLLVLGALVEELCATALELACPEVLEVWAGTLDNFVEDECIDTTEDETWTDPLEALAEVV